MAVDRVKPLRIIRGEPFEHPLTLRVKATQAALDPWPADIAASLSRNGVTVNLGSTEDPTAGTALFALTDVETADMALGLWNGGVQVDGRTWLRWSAIVEGDPTP